jgi:excisionase family DNA binding protein
VRQKPPPEPVPLLALTPTQVCEALQIGRDQFDEWSHRSGFPVIRDGKTILVPLESLKAWLVEQAASTNGSVSPRLEDAHSDVRSFRSGRTAAAAV